MYIKNIGRKKCVMELEEQLARVMQPLRIINQ